MLPYQPNAQQSICRPAPARCGRKWRPRFFALQTDVTGLHSRQDVIIEDEESPSRGNGLL